MNTNELNDVISRVRNDIAGFPDKGMHNRPVEEWTESDVERVIDRVYLGNPIFRGKTLNLERLSRFTALESCAQWLKSNCEAIDAIELQKPNRESRCAYALLDMGECSAFESAATEVLGAMCALSDRVGTVSMDGVDGTMATRRMRLSFLVDDIWAE